MATDADRFAGCLIGLAIGDALGADLEGYRGDELLRAFVDGRYDPEQLRLSRWTDDTAMAIATARSIVDCSGVDGEDLAARYLQWFESGGRGIGRSTFRAMHRLMGGAAWDEAGDTGEMAAGNGVAMRIAPVGLLHYRCMEGLQEDVRTCGVITHRNEEALRGGECVAYSVARATREDFELDDLGGELLQRLPDSRCRTRLQTAVELYETEVGPVEAMAQIGLGGAAFETVPCSLYCLWQAEGDLETAMCLAVLAGGDADTRGAITGAIAGAHWGLDAVPENWRRSLSETQELQQLAESLLETTKA